MASLTDTDAATAMQMAQEALEQYEDHYENYDDSGEFLPLSVYATRGFNVQDIEANSRECDKRNDPVLGMCYRVRILRTGRGGVKGTKRASSAQADIPQPKRAGTSSAGASSFGGGSGSNDAAAGASHKYYRHILGLPSWLLLGLPS